MVCLLLSLGLSLYLNVWVCMNTAVDFQVFPAQFSVEY